MNTTASSSFSTSIVIKVNGIDDHHPPHQNQNHNTLKDSSANNKNDAPIVAASTIVSVGDGSNIINIAAPELQEKIVQTQHHHSNHHSSVNKADVDKKGGSISDGGSGGGGGGGSGGSIGGVVKRRNRYTNGTLIRSHSFDNGKYDSVHGKMLIKSKTLGSSMSSSSSRSRDGSKKTRNKTLSANGHNHCSVDRLDETRTDCKRRRLFRASNVDQSPLWTTLTHARTMSDFVSDS